MWTPALQRITSCCAASGANNSRQVMAMTSAKPKTIHDGGRYFEGPRWHAGRLWFVDCMARTLLSLGIPGECEQHAKFDDDTPCGLGVLKEVAGAGNP